ncbi:MAG: hypothetical protein LBR77_06650 [Lachnospiraceae bacterium]|jgi:hypothetical protein|nr:hypothetical protein [Lachnospiraceae bacterium]
MEHLRGILFDRPQRRAWRNARVWDGECTPGSLQARHRLLYRGLRFALAAELAYGMAMAGEKACGQCVRVEQGEKVDVYFRRPAQGADENAFVEYGVELDMKGGRVNFYRREEWLSGR